MWIQEFTDSEEDDDSQNSSSTEDEDSGDEDSGDESGLGHTHSGSSGDESQGPAPSHPQANIKRCEKPLKTDSKEDNSNSIDVLANKIKQTKVVIQPVEQKGSYFISESH